MPVAAFSLGDQPASGTSGIVLPRFTPTQAARAGQGIERDSFCEFGFEGEPRLLPASHAARRVRNFSVHEEEGSQRPDPDEIVVLAGGFAKRLIHQDCLLEMAAGAKPLTKRPEIAGQIVVENSHFK